MTTLAELSSDILQLILRHGESIELWKCGSKRLMSKLANGGVTSVTLCDHHPTTTSRFPFCLSSFRNLRSLSINRGHHRLMESEELGKALQSLSSSLESLELVCVGAESAFLPTTSLGSIFAMLDEEEAEGQPEVSRSLIWSVKSVFPALKSLHLKDVSTDSSWTGNELDELPSSLTSLRIAGKRLLSPLSSYKRLPEGLLTLELGEIDSTTIPVEFYQMLPRGLTSLGEQYLRITNEALPHLPPSITHLSLNRSSWDVTQDPAFCAPFAITSLILQFLRESRTVTFVFSWESRCYAEEFIRTLPRTLTTLHLIPINPERPISLLVNHLPLLPKNLTSMSVTHLLIDPQTPLDVDACRALSPPLRHFLITTAIGPELKYIPRSITSLVVDRSPAKSLPEDTLPPGLNQLSWQGPIPQKHFYPIASLRHVIRLRLASFASWEEKDIEVLPRLLLFLGIGHSLVTVEALIHLPPGLVELEVGEVAHVDDPFAHRDRPLGTTWSESMRKKLSSSYFPLGIYDYSDEMEDYYAPETWDNTGNLHPTSGTKMQRPKAVKRTVVLPELPLSLKRLSLESKFHYGPSLIPSLPAGLTHLSIPFISCEHPKETSLLPRGLTSLRTRVERGNLSEEDIANLPRGITNLSLHYRITDAEIASALPPNLNAELSGDVSDAVRDLARQSRNLPVVTPDPRVRARFAGIPK